MAASQIYYCMMVYMAVFLAISIFATVKVDNTRTLQEKQFKNQDFSATMQILDNWQRPFITKVFVVDKSKKCTDVSAAAFEMFGRTWQGNRPTYYRDGRVYYRQCAASKPQEFRKCKREKIKEDSAVEMRILKQKRICAMKQNAQYQKDKINGFMGVIQPDATTQKCPRGSYLCGGASKQNLRNQICIAIADDQLSNKATILNENCPITGLHISTDRALDKAGFEYVDWFTSAGNSPVKIGWSKEVDSLPLIDFRLEQKLPCMKGDEESAITQQNLEQYFQKNEKGFLKVDWLDESSGCSKNKMIDKYFDLRYTNMQGADKANLISLYELQSENGVIDIKKQSLSGQTAVNYNTNTETELKKIGMLFFSRPILDFNRQCQVGGKIVTRDDLFNNISDLKKLLAGQQTDEAQRSSNDAYFLLILNTCLIVVITACLLCAVSFQSIGCFIFNIVVIGGFTILALVQTVLHFQYLLHDFEVIQRQQKQTICLDKYAQIYSAKLDQDKDVLKTTRATVIGALGINLLGLVGLPALAIYIILVYSFHKDGQFNPRQDLYESLVLYYLYN